MAIEALAAIRLRLVEEKRVEVRTLERHLAHCPGCGTTATIKARLIRLRREIAELEAAR